MPLANETESLLRPQQTKWRYRKMFVIVIFLVLLCVVASLTFGCIYWIKTFNNKINVVHLKDKLPSSFGVSFNIQAENSSLLTSTKDVTVRWEKEPNLMRFQQKSVETPWNESIVTTVSILDHRAVVSYTLENKTSWICANDLKIFDWFSIFRLMMISTESNHTDDNCTGRIWTVPYEGQRVFICLRGNRIAYIKYDNKVAEPQEWVVPSRSSIKLPKDAPECRVKYPQVSSFSILEQGSANSTRNQYDNRKGEVLLGQPEIFARSTKPDCLFVHGIGVETPKSGFRTLTSLHYWGHIEKYTPQCISHKFIEFNTVDNGWDSKVLHEMFCEFATGSKSGGIIVNKLIISHSMGNNIIAAALHSKNCILDKASSQWFSVSAPWRGSKVVDTLETLCSGYLRYKPLGKMVAYILKHTKFCTEDGNMSPAYATLEPTYKSKTGITYDDLVSIAKQYVNGALCGTSPWGIGLNLPFSGALEFIQDYSKLEKPNDGVVARKSCDIFGGKFQNSSHNKFFLASVNHGESSTKFGCSVNLCSWFRHL
ncbi:uncharacterized protein LOC110440598 isoform X2 [Mizuhopecten yessoensis]|nr:uncharacterized protein LOC110440598 isoform X2 [Mizuhopecten yessoensis]